MEVKVPLRTANIHDIASFIVDHDDDDNNDSSIVETSVKAGYISDPLFNSRNRSIDPFHVAMQQTHLSKRQHNNLYFQANSWKPFVFGRHFSGSSCKPFANSLANLANSLANLLHTLLQLLQPFQANWTSIHAVKFIWTYNQCEAFSYRPHPVPKKHLCFQSQTQSLVRMQRAFALRRIPIASAILRQIKESRQRPMDLSLHGTQRSSPTCCLQCLQIQTILNRCNGYSLFSKIDMSMPNYTFELNDNSIDHASIAPFWDTSQYLFRQLDKKRCLHWRRRSFWQLPAQTSHILG